MYNLCFMTRDGFEEFTPGVGQAIKENFDKDGNIVYITMDDKTAGRLKKKFPNEDVTIVQLSTFMNEHWDEFTLEKLKEYEEKYDASPMWKYIYTDRYLIYRDYDYCVHTAAGLFAFWEYVFTTYKIDFYYDEVVATLLTYAAYLVGKKIGARFHSAMFMRACGKDLTHHYILNDPFEMMYDMPAKYMDIPVSQEELEKADEFLKGFEEKHSKPAFMQFSGRKPKWKAQFFLLPLIWIRQRFFNPHTLDKGVYIYYKDYETAFDPLKRYFRYLGSRKFFNKADLTKKFVYFPLHLQPEATTIVCAQKYEKQLYFIDNLAKSLPADTLLYVKEHYSFLGSRDNSFYRALQEYPNVVLIDPWEDSISLILKSQCVATLTGTAGQEAMMLRRPVIMCGHIVYEGAPGVMQVDEIYDNYQQTLDSYVQPTRDEVLHYMAVYMRSARLGNTYVMSEARLNKENYLDVAKSLYSYYREHKEK